MTSLLQVGVLEAQWWDPAVRVREGVREVTGNRVEFGGEFRGRYERREGNGGDRESETGLYRTRIWLRYRPVGWLRFSGMMQDARAPWWGENAPGALRDGADLHEGYFEVFPESERGFGMSAGRRMLSYGDGRLIGTPQWSNTSRTFDNGRVWWKGKRARLELLVLSPVVVRPGGFNGLSLRDRVWGMYNQFPDVWRKQLVELYVLRHEGCSGADRIGVNAYGFRLAGRLRGGWKQASEGVWEAGWVGAARQRGQGLASMVSRRWAVGGRTMDLLAEYKYASAAFDQMFAANHDRFGHEDLFGWRNLHNVRGQVTFDVGRGLSVNAMYNSYWLANARDALYNGSGKPIVRQAGGNAGRFVGQEGDVFATVKVGPHQFGAGYGHVFGGEFLERMKPGYSPSYMYVFHMYSF